MECRLCGSDRLLSILDLGAAPPCEKILSSEQLDQPECTYPLHLRLCEDCMLLQIPALITPAETFTEYAYYSSYSDSWVEHARQFTEEAIIDLGLDEASLIVEVASNDGYLLQHAVKAGIPCLGIEPAVNVGEEARTRGIPTVTAFLDEALASAVRAEQGPADLVVANNVYAHIPDIIGFTTALRGLLADDGHLSIEVHHALQLVGRGQFDTVYHEHYQYYTLYSAMIALATGGMTVVDAELIDTHGGSIRIWARPDEAGCTQSHRVTEILAAEKQAGLHELDGYLALAARAESSRAAVMHYLLDCRDRGLTVVGYGAPGKGSTLLNYCGIRPDLLPYTVDKNPYKHGKFMPGMRIPILEPAQIKRDRPDVVLALPWNLEPELTVQLEYIREWGGTLVFPLPTLHAAAL